MTFRKLEQLNWLPTPYFHSLHRLYWQKLRWRAAHRFLSNRHNAADLKPEVLIETWNCGPVHGSPLIPIATFLTRLRQNVLPRGERPVLSGSWGIAHDDTWIFSFNIHNHNHTALVPSFLSGSVHWNVSFFPNLRDERLCAESGKERTRDRLSIFF